MIEKMTKKTKFFVLILASLVLSGVIIGAGFAINELVVKVNNKSNNKK